MPKERTTGAQIIQVSAPNYQKTILHILGLTPLLCHRFPDEAKAKIISDRYAKGAGKTGAKGAKPKERTVEEQFADACYNFDPARPEQDGRYGLPTNAFRLAVRDGRSLTDLGLKESLMLFMPLVEMAPLKCSAVRLRIDNVGGRAFKKPLTACVRAEFLDWSLELPIRFNADLVSLQTICNVLLRVGDQIGVGAWRPDCGGLHGRFELAKEEK